MNVKVFWESKIKSNVIKFSDLILKSEILMEAFKNDRYYQYLDEDIYNPYVKYIKEIVGQFRDKINGLVPKDNVETFCFIEEQTNGLAKYVERLQGKISYYMTQTFADYMSKLIKPYISGQSERDVPNDLEARAQNDNALIVTEDNVSFNAMMAYGIPSLYLPIENYDLDEEK